MYCSVDDLRDNISGLTPTNTKAPTAYLEDLINRKTALINSYIGQVYKTPVIQADSPTPFYILKDICIDLCRDAVALKLDFALSNEPEFSQFPTKSPSDKAMTLLKKIKEEKVSLPDAEGYPRVTRCASFSVRQGNLMMMFGEFPMKNCGAVPTVLKLKCLKSQLNLIA